MGSINDDKKIERISSFMPPVSEEEDILILSQEPLEDVKPYSNIGLVDILRGWDGSPPPFSLNNKKTRTVDILRDDLCAFAELQTELDDWIWSIYSPRWNSMRIHFLKREIASVEEYVAARNKELSDYSREESSLWKKSNTELNILTADEATKRMCIEKKLENVTRLYAPIHDFLNRDRYFLEAFELFERKKCTRRLPKLPPDAPDILPDYSRAFAAVAASGLARRLKPIRRVKKGRPSEKLVGMARKLLAQIEYEGFDGNVVNALERIVSNSHGFRVDMGHDEIRRIVVKKIGLSFYDSFIFDSTSKGRAYPDIVGALLKMTGFEMSERHINRVLQEYDWIGARPDTAPWLLKGLVMTKPRKVQ